jgi:hypothetical protein
MKRNHSALEMGEEMALDELLSLLQEQTRKMDEFGEKESELHTAIVGQNWDLMSRLTPELDELSRELEAIDERRHSLVTQLRSERNAAPEMTFAQLIRDAAPDERRQLTDAHRALQIAVLRVKSLTGGIDAYVRGSLKTANAVLGELFPEQKGTMYSRQGISKPAAGHAIVLDHRL